MFPRPTSNGMKNHSVFQIAILIIFGALAIVGVLVFAIAVGGGSGNTVGRVEIWGTLSEKAFSKYILQISETDQRFAQVVYLQKDPATYESDLTNALAVGGGPDIFLLRQDFVIRNAGKVIPFGSILTADQFRAMYVDAGNLYLIGSSGALGLPILVDPLLLYWNKDMLSAANFAKPPAYWDEITGMAQEMTARADSGSIIKSGVALGEYANVNNAKDILSALILQSGGKITAVDISGRLVPALVAQTGASLEATEKALRFFTQFSDSSNVYYSWNRSLKNSRSAFASGDLGLYIGFGSEEAVIRSMNPNLNFDASPLPQVRDGAQTVGVARVYALAVSRASRDSAGSQTIASLLASPATGKNISLALGMSSALRDVLAQPAEGIDVLLKRETLIARSWIDPYPEKTADIFRAMIERVSSGAMLSRDAVQRANQEMADVLGL